MSKELKPCPFCGHKTIQESFFDLPCKVYRIRCPRCYIFMDNTSENMVMKAWNTRPIEDELKKRIKELEAILKHSDKRAEELQGINQELLIEICKQSKIWHTPDEVPDVKKRTVLLMKDGVKTSDFNMLSPKYDDWKCFCKFQFAKKWAYLDELEAME